MSYGCGPAVPYTGTAVVLVLYILLVIVLSTFGFGW
ncbi:YjcZ family sporulation protein [Paenibacillus sp. TAF58]|nr:MULTISPECIES: sporulation protein YjcZ [Paenibacillus]